MYSSRAAQHVPEERPALLREDLAQGIPQPVQSLPQRAAPALVPARTSAGAAPAVIAPAAHPVGATPRALGEELHLPRRPVRLQVGRQVGHGESPLRRLPGEQGGQTHVAELLVVAEGLAVRRDEDQGIGESRRCLSNPARQRLRRPADSAGS